jgi:predicted adenylyl cyclase CyaB
LTPIALAADTPPYAARISAPRRNIELKARDAAPDRSLEVCKTLGGIDKGVLLQRDTYFKVVHGRLKLREEEGAPSQLISYARPDEVEERLSCYRLVEIADTAGLKAALSESLGTRVVVSKRRRLFLWRDVRIHLDQVDGLGAFLEFEAVAPEHSDLTEERQKVRHLREAFAIKSEDLIDRSYSDLILAAG